MSTDHVDCNVVKLQPQSGRSDAEIASAIGGSEADVAKCHGRGTYGQQGFHQRGPFDVLSAPRAFRRTKLVRGWCERGDLNPYELALTRS